MKGATVGVQASEAQTQNAPDTPLDVLHLDMQTLKDLEIFESQSGGTSLFEFCNLARTQGGAKRLRRRMELPWSNAARIRATQESLSFILKHREVFNRLPSAYASSRVELYERDILPLVIYNNVVEFSLEAFSLWANHDRHYLGILRGVEVTCGLIRALRRFVAQAELDESVGELAPYIEEMHVLLAHPGISLVPEQKTRRWAWRKLRLDQVFRLHEKATIARILELIYETDALVAMADVTSSNGFVLPDIEEGPMRVRAKGLVHPFVQDAVSNPVDLDQLRRVLFLTGPNMAGKTTYLRAFATALYLAHLGMGVPAGRFSFVAAEQLFSSISLNDDLSSGVSYFRAEALRVKAVAEAMASGYRVVAVMDEPFKGTNVKDAFDASLAILERFATREDCLFMFSSHLIELSEKLKNSHQIDCCYFEAEEGEGRLRFDYLLRPGVSSQRLGMRVLHEEGVFELLDRYPLRE